MPIFFVIAGTMALAAQADDGPAIMVKGYPGAPFISPMGEPFRARAAGDAPFARWFQQTDRNRDGQLTMEEMHADAERFFITLDRDGNGEIDPGELTIYESEIAPEVQVNSKWKVPRQFGAGSTSEKATSNDRSERRLRRMNDGIDGYQINGRQGAARYGLLNLPEPVAGADADFNRGITLGEFREAATKRFQLLDQKAAGYLMAQDLEMRLPARPSKARRTESSKEEVDTRVGLPFPKGN